MKSSVSALLLVLGTSSATIAFLACGTDQLGGDGAVEDAAAPVDAASPIDSSPGPHDSGTDADAAPQLFTIKASVVGLTGAGLVLQNAGHELAVSPASGGATQSVTVAANVPAGTAFDVTVKTQPSSPAQQCVVTGGKGSVVAGDVATITVNCTALRSISGTVTGLDGKDLIVQNDSGSGTPEAATINMNGQFSFNTLFLPGATYSVSVTQQPTDKWQTCKVGRASSDAGASDAGGDGVVSGTFADSDVTDLVVTCETNKYSVSVNVSGVLGSGLVFQNNLTDDLQAPGNGKVTFTTLLESGANYSVTQLSPPTSPWQDCVVTNPSATITNADVTLDATCTTNKYKIKGTLSGLVGNGLVLQNNGGDDLTLDATDNGTFEFTPVASGGQYAVTIKTPPTGGDDVCVVDAATATGPVTNADITNIAVTCSQQKIVFVSSAMYTGDMGGLSGADDKCQGLATSAKLSGTFKAWLSDSTTSAATRLTHATVPYVRVDGVKVANDWNDLVDGSLQNPIAKTELNTSPPLGNTPCAGGGYPTVWTDTQTNGNLIYSGYTCSDWTSTSSGGSTWGQATQQNDAWTAWCSGGLCSWQSPIYCLQQ
jgi:hypothetical protein